jgi:hypothetical protein
VDGNCTMAEKQSSKGPKVKSKALQDQDRDVKPASKQHSVRETGIVPSLSGR